MYRDRRVIRFLLITFAISWGCWGVVLAEGGDYLAPAALPFFVTASFGPLLARLIVRGKGEKAGKGEKTRKSWTGLLVAVALGGLAPVVAGLITGFDPHAGNESLHSYFGSPVVFFVVMLAMGPLSEEPGWRGYLHPLLRREAGPLKVALLFGPLWAFWHLPLFLIDGTYQHTLGIFSLGGLAFLVGCVALTVLIPYAYEKLAGLPGAITVHFVNNTAPVLLGLNALVPSVLINALQVVLAAVVIVVRARSAKEPRRTELDTRPRTGLSA